MASREVVLKNVTLKYQCKVCGIVSERSPEIRKIEANASQVQAVIKLLFAWHLPIGWAKKEYLFLPFMNHYLCPNCKTK